MAALRQKGWGAPSGVGEINAESKASGRKGSIGRSLGHGSYPQQEGTEGGQSDVKVLTQGRQKKQEIEEKQKRQEKAKESEGLLDERKKGEEKTGTERKEESENRVIIAGD